MTKPQATIKTEGAVAWTVPGHRVELLPNGLYRYDAGHCSGLMNADGSARGGIVNDEARAMFAALHKRRSM